MKLRELIKETLSIELFTRYEGSGTSSTCYLMLSADKAEYVREECRDECNEVLDCTTVEEVLEAIDSMFGRESIDDTEAVTQKLESIGLPMGISWIRRAVAEQEAAKEQATTKADAFKPEPQRGQDIDWQATSHELAAILIAGPDLRIVIPDPDTDDWGTDDEREYFANVGRVSYDSVSVFLSPYFLKENAHSEYKHSEASSYFDEVNKELSAQ